ncbi:tRNA (adenosine(37)-N6)-dimethylallyltransferase MiaA [Nocardiopsis sp. RSe5-2]|uniref:tRNA dimethylallyltransferase n=1 Tax=Nocardiopsis endophytica TaxID=3018445 RepID=A0ABT4U582_9ACTN|nr:tRNA (adenosine(37)-N6)-dimethylallyltransferase MiaA [Nocardiopsis endophytica]MDA2812117.1 tRNA (adenosine(37)-N6)-dimethylallyltransferase MiaA [Nocardiopsis endophytica]
MGTSTDNDGTRFDDAAGEGGAQGRAGIPVVSVVGPTAAGKSDLAVDIALRLRASGRHAEIINADSMQLYRGMDIGTAKMAEGERRGVEHHLLDIWDVTEPADVARFQYLARGIVDRLRSQGAVPILVGGSGLYVRAVLDKLEFPGTDPRVRARLEAELAESGPGPLHARLAERDPAAAEAILPSNGRRIVRALEVIELTGRPFTATLPDHVSSYPSVQVGLEVPRPELDERIELRVDRMWQAGLVEEVRALEEHGLSEGRTAPRALGYAQVLRFLRGECTEEEAREETVRATRRFARRQESWFRRDPRVQWLPYDAPDLTARALALVEEGITAGGAAPAPPSR